MKKKLQFLGNTIFYTFCILFMYTLFAYSHDMFLATKTGLLLWYNNILPSLFGFIIAINLITSTNIIDHIIKFLNSFFKIFFKISGNGGMCWILGMLAGYPLGAKTTVNMLESEKITLREANKLICFVNNCGPIFILTAVATNMFKDIRIGIFLIFIQIISSITIAVLLRFFKTGDSLKERGKIEKKNTPISLVLNNSIINAIETIINIGGIIIFFCIVIKMFELYHIDTFLYNIISAVSPFEINKRIFSNLFFGMIEMTNGVYLISLTSLTMLQKVVTTAFLMSFGGFCVHFQTYNVMYKTKINFPLYIFFKLINGLISAIYTILLFNIFF